MFSIGTQTFIRLVLQAQGLQVAKRNTTFLPLQSLIQVSFSTTRGSHLLIPIWSLAQIKGGGLDVGLTYPLREKEIVEKTRGKPRMRSEKRRLM